MKSLLNIAPVLLFAVALMQLYRVHMELKYNYESLAWQLKNKTESLDVSTATLFRRTARDVRQTNCGTFREQASSSGRAK